MHNLNIKNQLEGKVASTKSDNEKLEINETNIPNFNEIRSRIIEMSKGHLVQLKGSYRELSHMYGMSEN